MRLNGRGGESELDGELCRGTEGSGVKWKVGCEAVDGGKVRLRTEHGFVCVGG